MPRRTATLLCLVVCTAATWVAATTAGAVDQESKNGCTSPDTYSGALTSPPFDAVEAAAVTFQAWFEVEAVAPSGRDEAILQYDLGLSGDWVEFARLNPVGIGGGTADQGWSNNGLATPPSFQSYNFFLPAEAQGQSSVRIRFLFDTGDDLFQGFRGVGIDQVSILTGGSIDPPTQGFEGATDWTPDPPAGPGAPSWHLATNQQNLFVTSPLINPDLVTLPDSGALPPTPFGSGFAWFGDDLTGTYCGPDYANRGIIVEQGAPDTTGSGPSGLIGDRTPTFTFTSDTAGATFECDLDDGGYEACTSPYTPSGLSAGPHSLLVRAVSALGTPDPTPASFSFTIAQTLADLPTPQLGKNVNVAVVEGTVLVGTRSGGSVRYVRLEQARQIAVGSFLDTTRGTVRLVGATGSGSKTQAGNFFQGIFQVKQSRKKSAKGLTELRLAGGKFGSCRATRRGSASAQAAASKTIRSLRGNAKGKFRTRGKNASATVRGTSWGTIDRCDGTLTRVRSGRVAVRDFRLKRTIILRAGQTYLARARG